MNVRQLIAELEGHDPEAEVHVSFDEDGWSTMEADHVYAGEATYGILTPAPRTVRTVVVDISSRGL